MSGITMQEYFDKTVEHLASMPHRATKKTRQVGNACSYLTPEGLKCAVGIHIPDGHEAQTAIGSVFGLSKLYPDLAGMAWPENQVDLALSLQGVHDPHESWDSTGFIAWSRLNEIAIKYKLDSKVVKTAKKKKETA